MGKYEASLILSFVIFWSYVIYIWIKHGVHTSISASWYSLKNNQKWMFTMWCWGFAVPLTIVAMMSGGGILTFFSGAFIAVVGAAPRNMDGANQFLQRKYGLRSGEKVVHKIAAYTGVLLVQLALLVEFAESISDLFVVVFIISSLLLLPNTKKAIWWIEAIAYSLFWLVIWLITRGIV